MARTCGACGGTGSIIGDPCQTCRGETRVAKELKLNVKVPPGVEDGTRIRYAGEGDAGRSAGIGPRKSSQACRRRFRSFSHWAISAMGATSGCTKSGDK